eukprot:TRINITY_DN1127_c0_g1_i1.p1 TRINITY_DN1127_c0_g1~~TRINITY_DN1127_c0_g1_i1.p1  ORF type:complete len:326 (+),score=90.00 TRINITY_DN1127_c0_g1_i1:1-978(+)
MKMKLILFVFSLVLFMVSSKVIMRNRVGRSVSHQSVLLHLDFHGSCDDFIGQNIKTSTLNPSSTCLPITGSDDSDDVTTEIICHNTGRNNAKIDVINAFLTLSKTPVSSFVVSFIPQHEFKSSSNVHLTRPFCVISNNLCDKANPKVISVCEDVPVDTRGKGIVNKSTNTVYIVSNNAPKPTVCFDSLTDTCCSYISPTNGICKEFPASKYFFDSEYRGPQKDINVRPPYNNHPFKKDEDSKSSDDDKNVNSGKKQEQPVKTKNNKKDEEINDVDESEEEPLEQEEKEVVVRRAPKSSNGKRQRKPNNSNKKPHKIFKHKSGKKP